MNSKREESGRFSEPETPLSERALSARIPQDWLPEWDRVLEVRGLTQTEAVREAVRQWLDRHRSLR